MQEVMWLICSGITGCHRRLIRLWHWWCFLQEVLRAYTVVWDLGDVGIGLMTIFNTAILYLLGGEALKELREYEAGKACKKKSLEEWSRRSDPGNREDRKIKKFGNRMKRIKKFRSCLTGRSGTFYFQFFSFLNLEKSPFFFFFATSGIPPRTLLILSLIHISEPTRP